MCMYPRLLKCQKLSENRNINMKPQPKSALQLSFVPCGQEHHIFKIYSPRVHLHNNMLNKTESVLDGPLYCEETDEAKDKSFS